MRRPSRLSRTRRVVVGSHLAREDSSFLPSERRGTLRQYMHINHTEAKVTPARSSSRSEAIPVTVGFSESMGALYVLYGGGDPPEESVELNIPSSPSSLRMPRVSLLDSVIDTATGTVISNIANAHE